MLNFGTALSTYAAQMCKKSSPLICGNRDLLLHLRIIIIIMPQNTGNGPMCRICAYSTQPAWNKWKITFDAKTNVESKTRKCMEFADDIFCAHSLISRLITFPNILSLLNQIFCRWCSYGQRLALISIVPYGSMYKCIYSIYFIVL